MRTKLNRKGRVSLPQGTQGQLALLTASLVLALAFTLSCSGDDPDHATLDDFSVSGTGTAYFDGKAKAVTVTAKAGKTDGAVTVYYEGTDKEAYPKTITEPVFLGNYNVTFDVAASKGWSGAIGLSAGMLAIEDGTPAVPSSVSATLQSSTEIKVNWSSGTRADSYKVYYITEGMDEISLAGEVSSGTSFTHTGLTLDATYYYYVTAVNEYGESDYSEYKALKIDVPVAPGNLEATVTSSSKISVRWGAVEGAASYRCDLYNGSSLVKTGNVITGTSINWQGLSANTTHTFRIVAINAIGESSYSTVSAKTYAGGASDAPTGVWAEAISDMITVHWNKTGATYYNVYYAEGSPNNTKWIGASFWTLNYAVITSVKPNTTYYLWVTALYGGFGTQEGGTAYDHAANTAATGRRKQWAKNVPWSLFQLWKMQF